jgi:hypothetical protein
MVCFARVIVEAVLPEADEPLLRFVIDNVTEYVTANFHQQETALDLFGGYLAWFYIECGAEHDLSLQ